MRRTDRPALTNLKELMFIMASNIKSYNALQTDIMNIFETAVVP